MHIDRSPKCPLIKPGGTLQTMGSVFLSLLLIILFPFGSQAHHGIGDSSTSFNPPSQGGNHLRDVISGIYGGDGIRFPNPTHNAHFTNSSQGQINALNSAIVSQLNLFAINSTVTGYTFDTATGEPIQQVKSLGPIFGERANTIGKGRFDFQMTFTRANYTRFNGRSLNSQNIIFTHDDTDPITGNVPSVPPTPGNPTFENDIVQVNLNIDIIQEVVAAFFTYGITDNWDVNLVVPYVHNNIKTRAQATVIDNGGGNTHQFGPGGDPATSTSSGDATGIGDVILRTKYNFLRGHNSLPDMAVRGDVTFPTGDEKDLHGTGNLAYRGTFIGSKYYPTAIGPWGPHVNLSLQFVENHTELNNFSFIAGFDVAPHPRFAVAIDFLGRYELNDKDNIGKEIIDFAPGFKWAFYKQYLLQSVVQIPINKNEGLRADAIWTAGVGATF